MKLEITLPEVFELFKEMRQQPESLFEMIRANVEENVGQYLSAIMDVELTSFLDGKQGHYLPVFSLEGYPCYA